MLFSKEELYNEIKRYIYAHNFSDLKVLSKQYLHSIAMPSYSDNSNLKPYSIISIDFNDMAKINENGMKKGDKILHDSIKYMLESLPEGSFGVRIGGDEFFFLLPETEKENALQYEKAMHSALSSNAKKLNSATVTSHCVHSSEADSLSEMIEIADSAINVKKQNAKAKGSVEDWDILQDKITENFSTFFKNLRFHNFPMRPDHLKEILTKVIMTYDTEKLANPNNQEANQTNSAPSDQIQDIHRLKNIRQLNSLLISGLSPTDASIEINNIDTSVYVNLLNNLVRDPVTMQFNKSYLINQVLGKNFRNYNAMRISSTFVKVSNTINSTHSTTDKQIKKLSDKAHSYLSGVLSLNNDPFAKTPSNFLISLDGGDMLLVMDSKSTITENLVEQFIQDQDITHFSHDDLLKLVSSGKFDRITNSNLHKVLQSQAELCNKKKIPIIENFLSDELITDLLSITLQDTMDFYNMVIPNSNDITSQAQFFNLVSKTVLDLYSSLDVNHDESTLPKKQTKVDLIKAKLSGLFNKKQKISDSSIKPSTDSKSSKLAREEFIAGLPNSQVDHERAIAMQSETSKQNTSEIDKDSK